MDSRSFLDFGFWIAKSRQLPSRRGFVLLVLAWLSLVGSPVWAEETEAERMARLEKLTVEEKLELERKRERFELLGDADREKLRKVHKSLEATPNAAQLQETLSRYTAWLNTLTSGQRAELLTMKCDERIARIKELMRQQEMARFRTFVEADLGQADRDAVYKWVVQYITEHKKEIESRVPGHERGRLREAKDEAGRTRLLAFWLQFQLRDPSFDLPPQAATEIVSKLSPEAQQQIAKAQTPEEQQKRLEDLIRAAILSHAVPRASDEDLRKFYAELPVEARARLEGLEGEELKNELRRMYNFTRFQRGGPWGSWGPGRGPGPGGPGRREGDRGRGGPPRNDDQRGNEDRRDDRDRHERPQPETPQQQPAAEKPAEANPPTA